MSGQDVGVLLKDLIELPEQVNKGDFVLNLADGVEHPRQTLEHYVVTPQLKDCFDNALKFVRSSIETNTSKAAYLHGSFGSGKSHFMAVLHLILQQNPDARAHPDLRELCARHEWVEGKKFLLVPFHMIGAASVESGILGGYAEFVRHHFPDAPYPAVYLADELLEDAENMRQKLGDEKFFAELNAGTVSSGWGKLQTGWDPESFEAARAAPPTATVRQRLVSRLVSQIFSSYSKVMRSAGEAFVPLDEGLAIVSQHAKELGYDGLILFLDELILWLASRAADVSFVRQEGPKLTNLVEFRHARALPIVSFVARQRDLRELVGEHVTGADQLSFSDVLSYWEGRFHRINLEDRNLPEIAEKRVLRPRSPEAREQIDEAFKKASKVHERVLETLLTSRGSREDFRKVYPFSPALVETLVAVSSVLQRERTALKVMMELLVARRETLALGEIVPVGDLFDIVAYGEEAFTDVMKVNFDNAKRVYHQKLRPLLEEEYDLVPERDVPREGEDPDLDNRIRAFRNDDRLIKTLLLSALVPEVESLKNLTPDRLAALNHGTIRSPIAGKEGSIVLGKLRKWAGRVGELRLSDDSSSPTVSIQLFGVDTEGILAQARSEDNAGNRRKKIRELLYKALKIESSDPSLAYTLLWRGTRRSVHLVYANVREQNEDALRAEGADWKLVIDFPFDEPDFGPRDDLLHLERSPELETRTLVWLPSFFSQKAQKELGTLVMLDHILSGERFEQYASHLSAVDRPTARTILKNQHNALESRMREYLEMAYGVRKPAGDVLNTDLCLPLEEQFVSLWPGFEPRPPVGADLRGALLHLLHQALEAQFPRHPRFPVDTEIRATQVRTVWHELQKALATSDGRAHIEARDRRARLQEIATPLELGVIPENYFVLARDWLTRFDKKLYEEKPPSLTVRRLYQWMDADGDTGLPPLLRDLVVLVYAGQTNRVLTHLGHPVEEPEPGELKPDMELQEQALPSQADWEEASRRARELFRLNPSPLLNAANVASLARKVSDAAASARLPFEHYPERLRSFLERLHPGSSHAEVEGFPRLATARAAVKLLESLRQGEPHELVATLAGAGVGSGLEVLRYCLDSACANLELLQNAQLDLLDGVARLEGERREEGLALLEELREAARRDEFEAKLREALPAALKRAVNLLVEKPPPPPPPPPPKPGRKLRDQGAEKGLSADQARALLQRLLEGLEEGEEVELSWRIWSQP